LKALVATVIPRIVRITASIFARPITAVLFAASRTAVAAIETRIVVVVFIAVSISRIGRWIIVTPKEIRIPVVRRLRGAPHRLRVVVWVSLGLLTADSLHILGMCAFIHAGGLHQREHSGVENLQQGGTRVLLRRPKDLSGRRLSRHEPKWLDGGDGSTWGGTILVDEGKEEDEGGGKAAEAANSERAAVLLIIATRAPRHK
jgi:hypothetical protein